MWQVFRHAVVRYRGAVLGFGLALFALGWPIVSAFEVVQREQEKIAELARNFEMFITAAGGDVNNLGSPENFLSMRYFSVLPLILGIYAVLAGSGLLAADEENGTLDLVLAHPVSRTALFLGRLAAFAAATVAILGLSWLGFVVAMSWSSLDVSGWAMARPFVSLLAVLFFFGGLALLLSMTLPSRRLAAMSAGMVLLASFFLTTLARMDPGLETVASLSPLAYYQSGDAIDSLNVRWFAGLLIMAGLFAALAWWLFERRDIRVVGEGGWRWRLFSRKAPAKT